MSGKEHTERESAPSVIRVFWIADFFVLLFFLSTAAAGIYMFRLDLLQTIESRTEEPAGIIVIRNNIVQRRHEERVLWDRLFVDSLVYPGDLIRAADLSSATIHIDDNKINLDENTLIRIQHYQEGAFHVELREGNLSLSSGTEGAGIILNVMGRQVQAAPGTVINAAAAEDGIVIQVSEGTAAFIQEGQSRELSPGTMVAQDSGGGLRVIQAAVVTRPQPDARYLKNGQGMLSVSFQWNRINLEDKETLRLEIAGDRNFTQNLRVINGLDNRAQAAFETGLWHWRLIHNAGIENANIENANILGAGQFTVTDASGPALLSPASGSLFRYQNNFPQLRFQWSQKQDASQYILEVSGTPDFEKLQINRQLAAVSFIQSELGAGTWYWRVKPVFPSIYEGTSAYSPAASFKIEQSGDPHAPAIEVPEPSAAVVPEPVRTRLPTGRYYTVQPGDSLNKIARQEYGDASFWIKIFDANNIENQDLIYPSQVLYIP
jgi:hypothetical protein